MPAYNLIPFYQDQDQCGLNYRTEDCPIDHVPIDRDMFIVIVFVFDDNLGSAPFAYPYQYDALNTWFLSQGNSLKKELLTQRIIEIDQFYRLPAN